MSKLNYKYSDDDVSYSATTNYDVDTWAKHFGTTKLMLETFGKYMLGLVNKRFDEQKGISSSWHKLSKLTYSNRAAGTKIMSLTGKLRNSQKVWVFKDKVSVGFDRSAVPYGKMLHDGATYKTTPKQAVWLWHNVLNPTDRVRFSKFHIKKVTVPKRQFLGFDTNSDKDLEKVVMSYLKKTEEWDQKAVT